MKFNISKQNYFIGIFLPLSLLIMMYSNAVAAQRMPIQPALPDIFQEEIAISLRFRSDSSLIQFQFSNMTCGIFGLLNIISFILYFKNFNAKKIFFIYGIMCLIRSVCFIVTSFPAPCSGLPNCPCADQNEIERIRQVSPLVLVASWLFSLGFGLGSYPQCGDLTISGHTMFLWISFLNLKNTYKKALRRKMANLLSLIMFILVLVALIFIILLRHHYTIDVVLGILVPQLLWMIYTEIEEDEIKSSKSIVQRFIYWLELKEEEEIPLLQIL